MGSAKEKILGASGSLTGALGFLGGYQVCHSACLALISFLTFLGFAAAGMPLLFLTEVAVPFWIAAFSLLLLTIAIKFKKIMHFSGKMILLNSGLVIAGVPFQKLQQFKYIFWTAGGALVLFSAGWYFYDKFNREPK